MGLSPFAALGACALVSIYWLTFGRSRSLNHPKNISWMALMYSAPQAVLLLYLSKQSSFELWLGAIVGLFVTKLALSSGVTILFSSSPRTSFVARSSYITHLGVTSVALLPLALSINSSLRTLGLIAVLVVIVWLVLLIRNRERLYFEEFENFEDGASAPAVELQMAYRARVTLAALLVAASLMGVSMANSTLTAKDLQQGVLLGILICMPEVVTFLLRNPRERITAFRSVTLESSAVLGVAIAPLLLLREPEAPTLGTNSHLLQFVWIATGFVGTSLLLRTRLRKVEGLVMATLFFTFCYFAFVAKPENLAQEFQNFMTVGFPILLIILVSFFIKDMLVAMESSAPPGE